MAVPGCRHYSRIGRRSEISGASPVQHLTLDLNTQQCGVIRRVLDKGCEPLPLLVRVKRVFHFPWRVFDIEAERGGGQEYLDYVRFFLSCMY